MTKEQIEHRKKLAIAAKILTIHGYRNSPIEDIHAGDWPKNKKGKYASPRDMIVTTTDGGSVVPWLTCSRISQQEMEHLNKTIYNQIYTLMVKMEEEGLPSFYQMWGQDWDEPKIVEI
ncbi:MAG: hypothetical protein V4481_05190 [Patescibacteria group bacterium]